MDVYTYDIQHIYKVISLHDSIGLLYKTYKRNSKYIFTKLYYSFCEYIYKKRERKIINEYSKCIFVSDKDKKFLMGNNKRNDSKIVVIPNGVNQCLLDKGDKFITDVNTIVFSGIMDYKPNIDAVVYFVNCVLPLILEANKNIIFYIVGKNPTAEVTQLKSDNVIVTGWVDDISEYVCKGSVYVSPLITGAGLKNKILEAMALKRPIVASSISVDGLNIKDGYHLYVADSREVFADKVLNLLNSSDKRDFLVKNAYELVGEEYTWDVVLNRYRRYIFDIKAES
ncbi:MAG: glycosyltransferase family 4 protein, partial [Spirosomataceae bacterium]